MRRQSLFWCFGVFSCLLIAPFARAQKAQHPLDALNTEEYWAAYDTIIASGHLDDVTHFESILLHEPAKSVVLAWKPGDAIPREADVVLLRKGRVIEARVDVEARKLESWKEIPGAQGPIFDSEITGLTETILADERVKKALAKRNVTDLNTVVCPAVPVGFFAFPEQKDHRIGWAECVVEHRSYHGWSRYIGGLSIEVDFAEKKVLQVFDDGVVPVAPPSNYEEAPEVARPGTKPGIISQPFGPSFQIRDGEVSWQNWHFRFRLDSRVGPIVSLVSIEDHGRRRSLLYEGNMSELFVPYMDTTRSWSTRVFFDAGEYYPGGILETLRPDWIARPMQFILTGYRATRKAIRHCGRARLACSSDLRAMWPGGTKTGTWSLDVPRGRWCFVQRQSRGIMTICWTGDLSRTGASGWPSALRESWRRGMWRTNL